MLSIFRNSGVGMRIGMGYVGVGLILGIAVTTTIWQVRRTAVVTNRVIDLRAPTAYASLEMMNGMNHSLAALRGWMLLGKDKFKEERAKAWSEEILPSLAMMKEFAKNWTDPKNIERLTAIERILGDFKTYQQDIEDIAQTAENTPASKILFEEAAPKANILAENITRMIDLEVKQEATPERKVLLGMMADVRGTLGLGLGAMRAYLLSGDESYREQFEKLWSKNTRRFGNISAQVDLLTPKQREAFELFAETRKLFDPLPPKMFEIRASDKWNLGNRWLETKAAPIAFSIKKELDAMLASQRQLMATDMAKSKRQISLLTTIEWILLATGLVLCVIIGWSITSSASKMADSLSRNLWLKTGAGKLSDQMRGDLKIGDLGSKVMAEIANYLGAQVGALYLFNNETEGEPSLSLIGSYAYKKRKDLSNVFKLGEGLVGQAALEKQQILVRNVPEDYVKVTSGLGELVPRFICVTPFLHEDLVKGVVEIGTLAEMTEQQMEYLAQAMPALAIAVQSAQFRTDLAKSLEESQTLSEELQTQQEELKASNEELEEQTMILKKSEEQLKTQQEELQASNEELEEKTDLLEKQKGGIEEKNMDLERARRDIEVKAEEFAIASKYKSEFLANMSHELRTPLNSLLLLANNLSDNDEKNLTKDQLESLNIIHNSGKDLLSLINEILDLSKIEAGRMELVLEHTFIRNLGKRVEKNFQHLADAKGLELKVHIDSALPPSMNTDKNRLEQILKNLVSNAIKFTQKGSISVEFQPVQEDVHLYRSGLVPEETVAIAVKDTGIGISREKQKIIFEAFQQAEGGTSRQYGGTGLGLSISKELAKLLGGEIKVESKIGEGSTFTIYLPLQPERRQIIPDSNVENRKSKLETQDPGLEAKRPKLAGQNLNHESLPDDRENVKKGDQTVLVIEDDLNFAKILLNQCHKKGFKCLFSDNGEAGLEMVKKYKPDAIILDVRLPDIDGWVVLDVLKKDPKLRHIPVHMMSVEEEIFNAVQRGAIGYITKPVQKEQLEEVFEKLTPLIDKSIKRLLLVEDDDVQRSKIKDLIGNGDVQITEVSKGKDVFGALKSDNFDCVVLDFLLPDMTALQVLEKLEKQKEIIEIPPLVVYTSKDLTREEDEKLRKFADSIIIKGTKSEERLLDETSIFLHRVVGRMPKKKQKMITDFYDKDIMFKDKKVLLVDDDMRNIYALSEVLKKRGLKALKAENGQIALGMLEKEPDVDLVLMDIMMPVMDGYEAIKEIRAQKKFWKLPIIALTAKAMNEDRGKCIAAGANDYLPKPVDLKRLISMMRVWLYR